MTDYAFVILSEAKNLIFRVIKSKLQILILDTAVNKVKRIKCQYTNINAAAVVRISRNLFLEIRKSDVPNVTLRI